MEVYVMIILKWFYAWIIILGIFVRSPKGLRYTRARAWLLARADRLHRRLSTKKVEKLELLIQKGILRYGKVGFPRAGIDKTLKIIWVSGPLELVPIKDLGVRT